MKGLAWAANLPKTTLVTGNGPRRIRRAAAKADSKSQGHKSRRARNRVRREEARLGVSK